MVSAETHFNYLFFSGGPVDLQSKFCVSRWKQILISKESASNEHKKKNMTDKL